MPLSLALINKAGGMPEESQSCRTRGVCVARVWFGEWLLESLCHYTRSSASVEDVCTKNEYKLYYQSIVKGTRQESRRLRGYGDA